jgi:tetratricopeptide (TPR) repeat protein
MPELVVLSASAHCITLTPRNIVVLRLIRRAEELTTPGLYRGPQLIRGEMFVGEASTVEPAQDALRQSRPDKAVAILDDLLASSTDLGRVVPLLTQLLRDSSRDMRLLTGALTALAIDLPQCGSYDHLDHRFRRRIADDRTMGEVFELASSRVEASIYCLIVVDDLLAMGRAGEAEARLRGIVPIDPFADLDHQRIRAALAERGLEPYVGLWHYLRGRIALARGDLATALSALAAALHAEPALYSARALAGQLCRRLGRGAEACAFFDLAPSFETGVYVGW